MLKEFREFAIKGNMLDLAIAVVLGAAFGAVIASLVADIFTPLIGVITGGVDFKGRAFTVNGVAVNYGLFINALINFAIVAFALFLVVKAVNRFRKQEAAAPAAPSNEEVLLTEIRDLLKSGSAKAVVSSTVAEKAQV
ncbi:MAG: large-conductance mechanosensitive channel protein MscL [Fimbriimonadaceae bacterium]|nr:large-conductance mechanosensitive channel protein MscL [Fimbriimonadaceae bacterium]